MLELTSVSKSFGGLHVLHDVSLSVPEGAIFGLIGPNGAGKTTVFNLITGLLPPSGGGIAFNGESLLRRKPHAITRMGIARTFQNIRLFKEMTLLENVVVGAYRHMNYGFPSLLLGLPGYREHEKRARERAHELLTWMRLDHKANDLADNLSIAGLLAVLAMIAGGVASGFRWRWGGGLAAGGGLALVGLAGLALGLTQVPIDAAHDFALIPADPPFTLTITRDVGYYLLIVASALALVLFFASLNDLVGDRRPGLNPWIAALGALAAVVAAAGPTLNEQSARFSDNWYLLDTPDGPPALLLIGRAVQIVLLVLTGLVGFLCVRRYGIGLAAGGALPYIWLGVSTLFELTDNPVGPAFRNPGSVETDVHGLTVIGIAALGSMLVLAIIAAYDQGIRERR